MNSARTVVLSALLVSVLVGCAVPFVSPSVMELSGEAAYVTVKIAMKGENGVYFGCASAVLIDVSLDPFTHMPVGVFLTARHAVERGTIEVGFYLPNTNSALIVMEASPPLKHPTMDAALFTVPNLPARFLTAVKFAASDPVPGSLILSAGYADCGVLSLAVGYVLNYGGWHNGGPSLLSTARTVPGMSGGAVLNQQGELVGITVAHGYGNRSLHYFVPISVLSDWLGAR